MCEHAGTEGQVRHLMSGHAYALAMAALEVNGPEDELSDWDAIPWRHHESNVRRLRQRIFKATRAQDYKTVRNLQRMMLRSWSNTLVSVRQVTQRNAGRDTAGVDGQVAITPHARMNLAVELHRHAQPWKPRPVKRVYIPKANGKLRGLGILLSLTVPSKPGYAMHWNPSGRPGSNPDPMGSDRAAPATTR